MTSFDLSTTLQPLIGGLLISFSTILHLYLKGRITGWSGIFYGVLTLEKNAINWKASIIAGLLLMSSTVCWLLFGSTPTSSGLQLFDAPLVFIGGLDVFGWVIGGLLVGLGTKLGNGCTSGHGVCGLPRLSPRSFVAVAAFMSTGILVATLRHYEPFFNSTVWPETILNVNVDITAALGLTVAIVLVTGNLYVKRNQPEERIDILVTFAVGVIFGLGLIISGMGRRSKILNFLTLYSGWDPSLAFVMAGAVIPNFFIFKTITAPGKTPAFAPKFEIPSNRKIDAQLVIGGALFGAGWGVSALCPGPALLGAPLYIPHLLVLFLPFVAAGQLIAGKLIQKTTPVQTSETTPLSK